MSSLKIVVLGLSLLCLVFQAGANAEEQDAKATNSENTFPVKTQQPMTLDKLYGGLKRGTGDIKPPDGYVLLPKDHTGPCSTGCTHRVYVKLKQPDGKQANVSNKSVKKVKRGG